MPLLTPSRLLFAVLSFLIMGFLWTHGLPNPGLSHRLPIIGHDGQPFIPQSSIASKPTSHNAAAAKKPTHANTEWAASPTKSSSVKPTTACRDVRGAADVMVVVRTSRAELSRGLPKHLKSLLDCAPNVAIFSDHSGIVDGIPVHDALESISANRTSKYDEFREYAKIKADKEYASNPKSAEALDKWKFLPMVYRAFQMAPSLRFYIFIEADTSLTWTNLLQWTDRLDYRIQYYTGATITQNDIRLAQSGPGILLSWGALRAYSKMYEERYEEEWESHVGRECCGDQMLASAMAESHVELASSFPLLQGEVPSTLDWTEKHWCAPIVSWHRMNSAEADLLISAQEKWIAKHGWATPYMARDAFQEFISPQLSEKKVDWDNFSSETVITTEPGKKEKEAKQKAEDERKKAEDERKKAEDERKKAEEEQRKKAEEESRNREKEKQQPPPPPPPPPNHDIKQPPPPSPEIPHPKPPHSPRARRDTATDWEKIGHTIKDAADSVEHCQAICNSIQDCLQWRYTPKSEGEGECHLGRVIRLGKQVEKKQGAQEWTSGWNVERIARVTKEWKACEKANWKFNQ
ncbi:hypothetical protein CC80DRAFT_498077 [Byssothecium circinans]|uniref:Glycosyltransferase family 31 protein n=1 Tax=Byssothecium circinans TaxID=147558 RepID=A0A6A5TD10_9PLEO|nr:hypothetical protein CC80DRAFT_498077 [Byssothecium circinans]